MTAGQGHSLVQVGHWLRTARVFTVEGQQAETGLLDQRIDRTVQMATGGDPGPHGSEPILPPADAGIRSAPMLDEDEAAAGLDHSPQLAQSRADVGDATERPGGEHCVDAPVRNRQLFGRAREVPDGEGLAAEPASADVPELD
jgi:hypothetical protein